MDAASRKSWVSDSASGPASAGEPDPTGRVGEAVDGASPELTAAAAVAGDQPSSTSRRIADRAAIAASSYSR